jgi:Tol biopolymer transport system component
MKRIDLASGQVLTLDDHTQYGAFPHAFPGGVAYRDSAAGGAVFLRNDGRRADDDFTFVFTADDLSIDVARRSGISRIASADGPARGYLWPSLSPAGDRVAFVVMQQGMGVVNVDGSALHILCEGDDASSPSWHPSGRWILFQRTVDGEWDIAASDLYVVSSTSAELRQLTDTPDLVELHACFSPDGSRVAFQAKDLIYVGEVTGQ